MAAVTKECAACGGPEEHASTWFLNSSDIFALTFVIFRNAAPITFFSKIGEIGSSILTKILFAFAKLFGMVTLHDDIEGARNGRSRVVWEEARRRHIPMQQVHALGRATELYRAKVNGKTIFFESVPIPPKLQREVLHIDDKVTFKKLLRKAGLPVPKSHGAATLSRAKQILEELKLVCVKPRSGSNGRHTYPYVHSVEDLETAFKSAKQLCAVTSIEEHLEGNVCRATCVGGKLIGFLESKYPTVRGDGVATIRQLITKANKEKPEGVGDIELTEIHEGYIGRRGYTLDSVLPEGIELPLTYRAGRSSGGSNREYGRNIHPSFIPLIEQAAVLTELPLVGFDLIIPDPLQPADSQKWGFIEANSLPWIDLHTGALYGEPVNVAAAVWDLWGKKP